MPKTLNLQKVLLWLYPTWLLPKVVRNLSTTTKKTRVIDSTVGTATIAVPWSDLGRSLPIHELTWYSLCQFSSLSCKTLKEDVFVSLLNVSAMSVQQQPVCNGLRWTTTAGVSSFEGNAVKIPAGQLLAFSPPATPVLGSRFSCGNQSNGGRGSELRPTQLLFDWRAKK